MVAVCATLHYTAIYWYTSRESRRNYLTEKWNELIKGIYFSLKCLYECRPMYHQHHFSTCSCLTLSPWRPYCEPVRLSGWPVKLAPEAAAALCVYGPESSATLHHKDNTEKQRNRREKDENFPGKEKWKMKVRRMTAVQPDYSQHLLHLPPLRPTHTPVCKIQRV